jgi:hypothetical protein
MVKDTVKFQLSLESVKRRAKKIAKSDSITHSIALDTVAVSSGYSNYRQMQSEVKLSSKITNKSVVQLHIVLHDCDIEISRKVIVPANLNLAQIHTVIQLAMGWSNSHLYEFRVSDVQFHDVETAYQLLAHFDDDDDRGTIKIVTNWTIADVAEEFGRNLTYTYDFGDSWLHNIVITPAVDFADGHAGYDLVSMKGLCPPEDCGGISEFNRTLSYFRRVAGSFDSFDVQFAKQRGEVYDWLGQDYDPYAQPKLEDHRAMLMIAVASEFDNKAISKAISADSS